jgi:N-acetylmuramoyl-L-alanine amidase
VAWYQAANGVNISPNLYTIGIEHEGTRSSEWPEAMYAASAGLLADIARRWSIPLDRDHVVGHCDIFAPKHFCPGKANLDRLIDEARARLVEGAPNFVAQSGTTRARTKLNLRRMAPTSHAERVSSVEAGTALPYAGWTSAGESIHGNAHWYRDADENFFWAGATENPIPGA